MARITGAVEARIEPAASPDRSDTARKHPLDELASRYYAPLLSFFRKRLRDTSEAQDLVQQVFRQGGFDRVEMFYAALTFRGWVGYAH